MSDVERARDALRDNGWATRQAADSSPWDIEAKKPKLFMAKKERVLLAKVGGTAVLDTDDIKAVMEAAQDGTTSTTAMVGIYILVTAKNLRFAWLIPNTTGKWQEGVIAPLDLHSLSI